MCHESFSQDSKNKQKACVQLAGRSVTKGRMEGPGVRVLASPSPGEKLEKLGDIPAWGGGGGLCLTPRDLARAGFKLP